MSMRYCSVKIINSLLLLFSFCGCVYAGSGAGGEIRFFNDSDKYLLITFSGTGCAGMYSNLTLVCEGYDNFAPYESVLYKYNWGVTGTWMNVMAARKDWSKYDQVAAPCGTQLNKRGCFADHHSISTSAYKVSSYHFTG